MYAEKMCHFNPNTCFGGEYMHVKWGRIWTSCSGKRERNPVLPESTPLSTCLEDGDRSMLIDGMEQFFSSWEKIYPQ